MFFCEEILCHVCECFYCSGVHSSCIHPLRSLTNNKNPVYRAIVFLRTMNPSFENAKILHYTTIYIVDIPF
jgi:hypothetical protein